MKMSLKTDKLRIQIKVVKCSKHVMVQWKRGLSFKLKNIFQILYRTGRETSAYL